MSIKTKIAIYLVLLALVDTVIPVPITAIVLLYCLFERPIWFKQWVDQIYRH